ncbi:thiamine phosphate synthase [Mesorhizobium xinjiangense]|uniref:thiamine phosphate synthase n=1 Tax=Mesorhizobium xinjiangense TaxID=2678685 RepID=UPI0012ECEFB0|nr:thiamine phosphate synthase [Mesorhizobium xinjiangense]
MTESRPPERCRLVLIAPPTPDPARLAAAYDGGDVASLILPVYDMEEAGYQRLAEKIVPAAQERGIAVMLTGEGRIAARVKADGLHVEGGRDVVADAVDRLHHQMMIGTGGAKTRDEALALGELQPDYIFFGRFGYDNKPEPHPRNLTLGRWWAEMVEIPVVVMGGNTTDSAAAVAQTGADFVALGAAVYAPDADPADAVARANAVLDAEVRTPGDVG